RPDRDPERDYWLFRWVKCGSAASRANASAIPIDPDCSAVTWLAPRQDSSLPYAYAARYAEMHSCMIGWLATAVSRSSSPLKVIIVVSGAVIVPDELMSNVFSLARNRPPSSKCSNPNPIGSNCLWHVAQLPAACSFS